MVERSQRRSVPQLFIDGESIGGYDDLAVLNATGRLDERLGLEPVVLRRLYDLIVIGAGPAGLSAALYAARKNLSTLIVAMDIGGQVGTTAAVDNYLGVGHISGPDLVQSMVEQLDAYDVEKLVGEQVTAIEPDGVARIVRTASGRELCGRAVLVASGAQKRHLGIPGEKELTGKGVVYCSTCDGPLFKDLRIAIVGGGNSALEAAIEMSGVARAMFLVSRGDWHADDILQDKVTSSANIEVLRGYEPIEIHGTDSVTGVTVRHADDDAAKRRLDVEGVFIEVGFYPNTALVLDLVETNEIGEIIADSHGRTGVKGVFAAGDAIETHHKQIAIAVGTGARAALAASEYLISQV
jgi:alkyl hydroperoxide reductase subunit F